MPTDLALAEATAHSNAVDALPDGRLFIDGRRVAGSAGEIDHINPTTGERTKAFSLAGPGDIDQAVAAARRALPRWRTIPPAERRLLLLRIADELERRADALLKLAVIENGTPRNFAGFVSSAVPAEWFRYYAGWIDKFAGSVPPPLDGTGFHYTTREPYGVIGAIIAFNAPMGFVGMKVPAALAAGNTIVLKPSELAPWSALAFADICAAVGLPEGVVNVVPGGPEAGRALVTHDGVNKVSFTGGGATAAQILIDIAPKLKPVALELGGKSANVIFDDADLDTAVPTAIYASVAQLSGQACIAGTRLLVQRRVYDQVLEQVAEVTRNLSVGDPFLESTALGPVISQAHRLRISRFVDDAIAQGEGRCVVQGKQVEGAGYFLEPTVIADIDPASRLAQEELFGPVLAVIPFDSDSDGIEIANNSRYGLAAYVFTKSLDRAFRAARDISAGTISVNSLNYLPCNLPFGGFKSSGFGREGGYEGIAEMTQVKTVQISLPADS